MPEQPPARNASTPTAFFRISLEYWLGSRSAGAWAIAAGLFATTLGHALLQLRLNQWLGDFFNALDVHAGGRPWHDLGMFAALALGLMASAAGQIWLKAQLQASWRRWLTLRLARHWLDRGHAYLLRFQDKDYDNPDYRIAEDVRLAVEATVDFAAGLTNSILILAMFLNVLWFLSQTDAEASPLLIPGYLAVAAIIYGVSSGAFTHLFGRRLVALSEDLHAREGDFRYNLVRAREDAEGIALSHGEADERRALGAIFGQLIVAWQRLIGLQTRLAFLSNGFTVAAPVVPLLIAAPQYLAGALSLGGLVQASQAFVQVQTALGFVADNYARISDWLARMRRIVQFEKAISELDRGAAGDGNGTIQIRYSTDGALRFVALRVDTPEGTAVIADASTAVLPGERVLLVGESGVGKTTLIRAIAGLWPWGHGAIELPAAQRIMFVPRRPYLPPGSLRAALAYPEPTERFGDAEMEGTLRRCGLGAYAGRLDEQANWREIMAEADQQRLSFTRILLQRPGWVLMDEATSDLDEATEADLLSLFVAELAGTTLVSTGQRDTLAAFHGRCITLLASKAGARLVREVPVPAAPSPGWFRRLLGGT